MSTDIVQYDAPVVEEVELRTITRRARELNWAFLIPPQVGVPSCAVGDPGTAKTETCRAIAQASKRLFHVMELSQCEPSDIQGLPVVGGVSFSDGSSGRVMDFIRDRRMIDIEQQPSIMLLDEITNVGPNMQGAALKFVASPPKTCWVYMACNPPNKAADGQPLVPPFINRIWIGDWQFDEEGWRDGMMNDLDFPAPDVPVVPEGYQRFGRKWAVAIIEFLKKKRKMMLACPEDRTEQSKPWPSPRQWSHVCRCLSAADAVKAGHETKESLVRGMVGEKACGEFFAFLAGSTSVDAEKLLKNPNLDDFNLPIHARTGLIQDIAEYVQENPAASNIKLAERFVKWLKDEAKDGEMSGLLDYRIKQLKEQMKDQK